MSLQLAEEIIKGRRLKRGEDLSFLLSEDLDELCAGADKIRKELCGNHVDLCSIINGRSGRAWPRTASFARSQPVIIRRWKNIHFWSQRRFWRTASVMRRRKYIVTPS